MSEQNGWEKVGELLDEFEEKFYKAKACCHDSPQEQIEKDVHHWLVLARRDLNSSIEELNLIISTE